MNGTKVYGTEGETVTLVCDMYSGFVEVAWFKGDTELDNVNKYYSNTDYMVHTKLVLESLTADSEVRALEKVK